MAPRLSGRPAWKRVTGMDATSRSDTLTPAELSPAIIARFSMRADRLESRLVTTVASFFSVVPKAMARRAANSGVMSTLASPLTPEPENRLRAPRDSQTIDVLTTAPGLDRLERVHLDAGADDGVLADEALVAQDRAVVAAGATADVAGPADHGAGQPHPLTQVGVVLDDAPVDLGVGPDLHVGAQDGVLGQAHTGVDPGVVADDGRARR